VRKKTEYKVVSKKKGGRVKNW